MKISIHPFLYGILIFCCSCKKDSAVSNKLPINQQWIIDSMRVYYYWADQLPKNPSANDNTTKFYKSLLNTSDRFSYLDDPGIQQTEFSSFGYYGFDYAFINNPAYGDGFFATITLVVPGSAAEKAGLMRGDLFTAVNATPLNSATVEQLTHLLKQGNGVQLQMANFDGKHLNSKQIVSLSPRYFTEQPVYLTRIFNTSGGKKTGYIFYDAFNGVFDRNVIDSLAKLSTAGVSDLIIDLRYNPGGDVSSAAKISGIVAHTEADQTFVIYQANKNGGRQNRSFQQSIQETTYAPQDFSDLKNHRLNLKNVIILTTAGTASSAELLINSLRPYISVIQIGQTTVGKDMASFAINDQRHPPVINLILHPLVFKLYNAQGKGDYGTGLVPDYLVDEFSNLPLKPFGDPQDPLIKKALEITGGLMINSNLKTTVFAQPGEVIFQSAVERGKFAQPVNIKNRFRVDK